MLVNRVTELIGNTPLLKLDPALHGLKNVELYAKLELLNPFGSVKDKSAWTVLKNDIEQIAADGKSVIESSSGNMAKAMQILCSMHGVTFKIVTNRIKVPEVKQVLQVLGAEVDELPGLSECPDPTDPNDPITFIEQIMSGEPGKYFHTSQYTNVKNIEAHYEMTGKEILADIENVDFFIGGLGTTGSTRGTGSYLREQNPQVKNIGVIASKGHLLPGIRNVDEMYEVGLFRKDFYDDIVEVSADESIDAMLMLIRKAGVLAGPTGGGSLAAALKYLKPIDETLTRKHHAVFIVCDRVEWYLSYLQKHRPSIFGITKKQVGLHAVTPAQIQAAPQVSADEAATLALDPAVTIVDLRGALAFKTARIAGAINIAPSLFEEMCEQGVPFSGKKKVLLVCPIGEQSKRFAAYLSSVGIDCVSLAGGMTAWQAAGKPCERHSTRTLVGAR
ncbi:MAG TPA: pyridoxal-phosphate dependent enzyme [Oculatellaceae cyanobacterium]